MALGEDVMPEDNAISRLISKLEQQAQDGDAAAACKLADHYREGNIIPQDLSLALHWSRRSAELGDPEAQNNLASMLLNGLGCQRDVVQAVQWYRMSAEQGLAIAQYNLAKRYLHGEGVDQDYAKAREWFERAVVQGDAWATSELGTMYRLGHGMPRNLLAAAEFHLIAAEAGDDVASGNIAEYRAELEEIALSGSQMASLFLSRIYNRGFGIKKSQAMTWAWIYWAKKYCSDDKDAEIAQEVSEAYDFYRMCITLENRKQGQRLLKVMRTAHAKRARKVGKSNVVSELDGLIAHIRGIWPDLSLLLPESDDRYQSLPLCIIDAVYSIGVRYESTERTVRDFCKWSHWNHEQEYTVKEFMALLDPFDGDWERLATEVFRNRQRTSSRSGILKAEAVYRFARGLQSCDVNTRADIPKEVEFDPPDRLVSAITAIPGHSSRISLKYFLMLAGYEGIIKPDRMVMRFVADALGRNDVSPDLAETLVLSAQEVLRSETPGLTAAILDYGIWLHQRGRSAKDNPKLSREVVLKVGGEGGSLTLVRQRAADESWQFRMEKNEAALYDMLSDEDRNGIEFSSQTEYVRSFKEALKLLDRCPWFNLYPLDVHPAFVESVLREVRKRGGRDAELRWRGELNSKLNNQ